ncbi:hypothetical protein HAZT_HAZT007195 [Hyalella azteca]|uniref:LRRCT domain-containing protein n=1 Tax=Hyalella azteca TaxID=294128 RepID=A0A6A0H5X4_HYAAZ|nr:hypothetical protein HAZT_HAZT007195 [Hyalella azteca]
MGMSTLLVRMLTMAATLQLLYTAQALHNSPNCAAIDERLRLPCVCSQEGNGIHINCDKVSFPGDFPILPQRVNIVSFQQRKAGIQALTAELFTNANLPIAKVDFSENSIRRLSAGVWTGLEDRIQELFLRSNLLGDTYSPVFSSPEIANLTALVTLEPLKALQVLRLEGNHLTEVPTAALEGLAALRVLTLQENNIGPLVPGSFSPVSALVFLNLSNNNIPDVGAGAFAHLPELTTLDLSHNRLDSLESGSLQGLDRLEELDLSDNFLTQVPVEAIMDLRSLKTLVLKDNLIQNLGGIVALGPLLSLRKLDLSRCSLGQLNPGTFRQLKGLVSLKLSVNSIRKIEDEAFDGLDSLEELHLDDDKILSVPSVALAKVPLLKVLTMDYNRVGVISASSFENVPLLQELSIAHNIIREIPADTFSNLTKLTKLNLYGNLISTLSPASFFKESVINVINLSGNQIKEVQSNAFQDLLFIHTIDLGNNRIERINDGAFFDTPYLHILRLNDNNNADIIVNIKGLDLSYNPLTKDDISVILNEPKTLRYLNLAGTNISEIPVIEARFLLFLNISDNHIRELKDDSFALTRNLHTLDVSKNKLKNLSFGLASAWPKLPYLRYLDISYNPFMYIIRGDLGYLAQLKVLKATHMDSLSRVERSALQSLKTLEELHLHSLPAIHSMDARGILESLPGLKVADIEITDSEIHDQLHPAFTPRLESLIIRGKAVEALSGGAFAGINSPVLNIGLVNTSVSSLFSNAFFPVPMSSQINLDVSNNKITSLSPQFLNSLNPRQRHLQLDGLDTNPLFCDCNARPLQRWLGTLRPSDPIYNVTCSAPAELLGRHIRLLKENELTCDGIPTTTTTAPPLFTTTHRSATTDNIITIEDVSSPSSKSKTRKAGILNDMDILIIGIVGGVISFVAFVILIACLVKYICDSSKTKHPVHMAGVPCTCLKPPMPPPSWGYPQYPTLPHPSSRTSTLKLMKPPGTPVALGPQQYGTLGARSTRSYHSNGTLPYYLQNCPPDYDQD